MKKSIILSAILVSGLVYNKANAQISIHVGLHIPVRHVYIPPPQPVQVYDNDGYDDNDDYYYLPEVEAYYSVERGCYYYQDGGLWVSAAYLPGAYRNYDWRSARRFEVRGRRPFMNHDVYRNRWGGNPNRGNWGYRGNNNYAGRYNNRNNNWDHNTRPDNHNNGGFNRPNNNHNNGDWNRPDNNHGNPGGFNRPNNPGNSSRDHGNWGRGNQQPSQPNHNYG